jgi:putative resolvase
LERQAGRVAEEAGKRGITLDATVTEVGSGVNGNLAKLRKILADPQVSGIVVEHRDRLARFGVEDLEAALAATGRRIIVLNQDEVKDDLVRDMTEVLTSMCARLYGRRSARRRAEAGVRCATAEVVAE